MFNSAQTNPKLNECNSDDAGFYAKFCQRIFQLYDVRAYISSSFSSSHGCSLALALALVLVLFRRRKIQIQRIVSLNYAKQFDVFKFKKAHRTEDWTLVEKWVAYFVWVGCLCSFYHSKVISVTRMEDRKRQFRNANKAAKKCEWMKVCQCNAMRCSAVPCTKRWMRLLVLLQFQSHF